MRRGIATPPAVAVRPSLLPGVSRAAAAASRRRATAAAHAHLRVVLPKGHLKRMDSGRGLRSHSAAISIFNFLRSVSGGDSGFRVRASKSTISAYSWSVCSSSTEPCSTASVKAAICSSFRRSFSFIESVDGLRCSTLCRRLSAFADLLGHSRYSSPVARFCCFKGDIQVFSDLGEGQSLGEAQKKHFLIMDG